MKKMTKTHRLLPLWLLGMLFLLPGVSSLVSITLEIYPVILYPLFQVIMLAVPVIVWMRSGQSRLQIREAAGLKRTNCLHGLVSGALMAGVIIAGYYTVFGSLIDPAPVLEKVNSLGLRKWYWVMAVVMSLWNSLYEEYYWRSFLASQLGQRTRSTLLICIIGGSMFGLHHLVVLLTLFDLPMVMLFTFGTMVAGAAWTWMRLRGQSIWDCYISHIIADLAVFYLGYDLIMRAS